MIKVYFFKYTENLCKHLICSKNQENIKSGVILIQFKLNDNLKIGVNQGY